IDSDGRGAALPPMLRIFAKSRGEDMLEPAAHACLRRALKELGEIAAFPEFVLENVRVARRPSRLEHLQEDLPPRPERKHGEQQNDRLHDHRRVDDQRYEREIGVNVHRLAPRSTASTVTSSVSFRRVRSRKSVSSTRTEKANAVPRVIRLEKDRRRRPA